jgi:flavin-dependent dehydrogenase
MLPFGSHRRKAHYNGAVLLGDAAGLIDPFSGEGVGNGMLSAREAARVIEKALKANDVSERVLKEYEDALWAELGPELQQSYRLQKLGRNTFLLNLVIDKAARSQQIRETLSGMLVNEEARKEFNNPLFYLKLLFA